MIFKCRKCGSCCKNLTETMGEHRFGLLLTPKEAGLFPRELVKPYMGTERKGRRRPRPAQITAYQLDADNCPHLGEDNRCGIYDRRPLSCRAFPVHIGLVEGELRVYASTRCKLAEESKNEPIGMNRETMNATARIQREIIQVTQWMRPLNENKWIPTAELAYEYLKELAAQQKVAP